MNPLRRTILAASLLAASLSPLAAFAQAPPPVPALPDTERRTSYVLAGTTCICSVGFALYGDSTDYVDWLQVWLNGALQASSTYTITSPTGALATIPRPITDAVLTFNASTTGTVQIVGARRPRRASQFQENRGVAARDLNQIITDLVAQNREQWDLLNRTLQGLPGEVIAPLPSAASRAGGLLCWDATGLIPLACAPTTGLGNVIGPNGATSGHIAVFSGATGEIIADGGLPGTGTVTGPGSSTSGNFVLWNNSGGSVIKDAGYNIIPLLAGGSNAALTASNGGLVYSTGSALAILAGTATANQIPLSGSNTAPAWSTATYPATTTANQILWSSANNTIAGLSTAINGVLVTSGAGVPSIGSTLPAAVQGNITTVGTIGSGVWNGATIGLGFGGTGQTTAQAARAASGLDIDQLAKPGDANYNILSTDRTVAHTALSTARTDTLPTAASLTAGQHILVTDLYGVATGGNTVTLARSSADTINGSTTILAINSTRGGQDCVADGASAWICNPQGGSAVSGVSSIGGATGSIATGGGLAVSGATLAPTFVLPPQGRLTLTSGSPVMPADAITQTTVFYDCFIGNQVPYFTGSADAYDTITSCEASTALQSSSTGLVSAANVFDVWWVHASNHICIATNGSGGGWASDTGGSNTARGTGYSQLDFTTRSYITNKNSITNCYNGATQYGAISANQATYLGTIFTTANGQTGMQFKPSAASNGTKNILGVFNAYNQVLTQTVELDNNASWTYTSQTWRRVDNSASNQVRFVDGLQRSQIDATLSQCGQMAAQASAGGGATGTIIDWSSGGPSVVQGFFQSGVTSLQDTTCWTSLDSYKPVMGFHTVDAIEASVSGANTVTFLPINALWASSGQNYNLVVKLMM